MIISPFVETSEGPEIATGVGMTALAAPVAPIPVAPSISVSAVPTTPVSSVPVVPISATPVAPIPGNFGNFSFSSYFIFFFCKPFLPVPSFFFFFNFALRFPPLFS